MALIAPEELEAAGIAWNTNTASSKRLFIGKIVFGYIGTYWEKRKPAGYTERVEMPGDSRTGFHDLKI